MRENISLTMSMVLECLIFIYYTNSSMIPRKSLMMSNGGIILGYTVLYLILLHNIPIANIISFVIVNFVLIYMLFNTKWRNAVVQTLVLTAMMMISEGAMVIILGLTSAAINGLGDELLSVKLIHGFFSKFIYFIGIAAVKLIMKDRKQNGGIRGFMGLAVIPIFTMLMVIEVVYIFDSISEEKRVVFAVISLFGVAANVVVYWMYDRIQMYHMEVQELQKQKFENERELNYCNMLEDKLRQTDILRHDFKEHLRILEAYIGSDNKSAMDYLKSIQLKSEEIGITNYTDNRVLNILLSEKQKLCAENKIRFNMHTSNIDLSFIDDIDIVSILSNLLNNAIESCNRSEKKIININIYSMNKSFVVIRMENSCDKRPIEENGFYKTTKPLEKGHGIGLKSIVKTLKKYDGDLRMEYSGEEKIFASTIMIPIKK